MHSVLLAPGREGEPLPGPPPPAGRPPALPPSMGAEGPGDRDLFSKGKFGSEG